ncbi:hypothetical protein RJ639_024875 [Escallonia herrerae]|uniref:Reverse transcriptase Ty1/copia-type domain-containing protein n=1 Tax=Escallonia herrerae TaxID=1293975 RepID=A0AA88SCJ9_9ASTE|nr:hypothetical protein RJ639_024875 [Escallonia herrerae]
MIETTALLAKGKRIGSHDNGEWQQRCSHCNKLNHTKETGYQLVGYPSHWTRKPARDARFGGSANAPHIGVGAALAAIVSTTDIQIQSPIPGLTAAQHQQLIALLGGSSVNTGSAPNPTANFAGKERIPWIIDTGATNHITCDPDSLLGAIPNSHIPPVQIPNGDSIPVQSLGRINLSKELILEQVLGDLPSMRPIGASRERNGLYYLERMGAGKALMSNAKGDAALWHHRLGHIPTSRLTLVPSLSFLSDNKEPWVCDACWYPNGKKGYRIFDLEDKHIYTSRDVQFFEENYPFARHNPFVTSYESQQPDSSVFGPHATMDSPLDVVHARNKPDDSIQTLVPSSESNCAIPELHSNEQQTEPKEVVEGRDPNKIISGASDGNNSTPESNSSLSKISIQAKRVRKVSSKLSGTDPVKIHKLKQYLDKKFHIKDLGKLKYFLGIEVARSTIGVSLSQRKYVLDILSESGLLGSKPSSTSMDQQHKLTPDTGSMCSDPGQYRRLVGRLLYLTITRPDNSYAVHVLSQFMHAPRQPHLDAALQVLRYLKGAPGQGILLPANSSLTLHAYCDADWAGCPSTRRSTTGYIIFLGSSPISWRSKQQSVVSRSSAEAEYRAMATTSSEVIWLVRLLHDLHIPCTSPVSLFCDNQAAIHIAANPVFHERTKHIKIDCHFIRQHIQSQVLIPQLIPQYPPNSNCLISSPKL